MEVTPLEQFNKWYYEQLSLSKASIPTACCLSTIGTDGYPNARFVSLKEVTENSFIITGPLASRKGMEISKTSKVALTFWWTETGRQVRIQGTASLIADNIADKYFAERNRDSQVVSIVSEQGKDLNDIEALNHKYQEMETQFSGKTLPRPGNWGGYSIKPIRIEFLEFRESRFHDRKLFTLVNGQWEVKQIQP